MVKANDLINNQIKKEELKKEIYKKIFHRIEKKITMASNSNFFYCSYDIPRFLIGTPRYSFDKCVNYIISKLQKNGFEGQIFQGSIIFISWYPKNKDK